MMMIAPLLMRPNVSVIMAVYRPHPVYFPEAVASILRQTMTDFELIIIEDPSDVFANHLTPLLDDPRVIYHRNAQRTSLVAQRNLAIRLSKGHFLAIMDADDISEPERLEIQVSFFQDHPEIDVVGTHLLVIDSKARVQGFRAFPLKHDEIVREMARIVPISQPSVMARRERIVEVGCYDQNQYLVAEDYALWSKMAQKGMRFANLPLPLLRYRWHCEQLKSTNLRETLEAVIFVKEKHWRGAMNWRASIRLWFEKAMLWLPPQVILHMIYYFQYRDHMPVPRGNKSVLEPPVSRVSACYDR